MKSTLIALLLTIGLSLFSVTGDFLIKNASLQKAFSGWKLLLLGSIVYALSGTGWFFIFRRFKLSTAGVIFSVVLIIFMTLLSVFYFKEKISTWEVVAIVMAIISMGILYRFA